MNAFILLLVLFTSDDVLTKALPYQDEAKCMEDGATVAHDLLGQKITPSDEPVLVLDVQFQCISVKREEHA